LSDTITGLEQIDLPLIISWFPTAFPEGPAIGDPERTTWGNFADVFWWRREGEKDGPNFVPARFIIEPDGRHVRRLTRNLLARTAIALDCETSRKTGEVPPAFDIAVDRIEAIGCAAMIYTSHSHRPEAPRYRIVLALSEEIAPDLPATEVMADALGLRGVLDESKLHAASLFYLPSMPDGCDPDIHQTVIIDGAPIDAAWMRATAGATLAARVAEEERRAAEAHKVAATRREAKIAAGFDPDDSLIEKLRAHFDLAGVLLSHGYDRTNGSHPKYRHPNSSSGNFGADIKTLGGVERVFSHNATDPLHASNLPAWCGGVTALDAVDATIILDFGGDRRKGLAALAERFGLTKRAEQKALAGLLFRLIRQRAPQEDIERQAYAEGARMGLSRSEVIRVATWVAAQSSSREAA
jgi:hypothetical protein